jgi:hypothetical protein
LKKSHLITIAFIFVFSRLFGQTTFYFSKYNNSIKTTDFYVKNIILKSKQQVVGEIFTQNNKTQKVYLDGGIESGILKYYSKYNSAQKKDQVGIQIEIEEISLSEKKLYNGNIEGKITYNLVAYTISQSGLEKLCQNRNSGRYTRSINNLDIANIENQFQGALDNGLNFIHQYLQKNKTKLDAFVNQSEVIIKPFKTKNSKDTVYYQQRKVVWSDFTGPYRKQSGYGAAIYTSFAFESKIYTDNYKLNIEITPMVFTDKNMSWAKPEIKNEYELRHEQLHFDICYLMTLKFLKKIKTLKSNNSDDLISMVQYEYLEFYKATHNFQELYDSQTNHSIIKSEQQKWQQKIELEIKQFDLKTIFK